MFDAIIARQARERPEAPAVLLGAGPVSFAALDADVDRAAALCLGLGASEGEPVALAIRDPYAHVQFVLALARLGLASAQGDDEGAPFRIGDGEEPAGPRTLRLATPSSRGALAGPRPALCPVRRDPDGMGRVITTSGTTGTRKRIALSWRVADARIRNAVAVYGTEPGARIAATGLDTALGFSVMMSAWAGGNPVVLGLPGLDAAVLDRFRPAVIVLIPDQLRRLLDQLPPGRAPGTALVASAGGPVPPALAERARLRLTSRLLAVYGTTEAGMVAVAEAGLVEARPGVAGRLVPAADVEIVDDAAAPRPRGAAGHVRLRGEAVAPGYLDDPALTRRNYRDGWFYPGDFGSLSEDGLLLIEGRSDELMNVAGHKVLPRWLESAALECPGVVDAGAFSLPGADGLEGCWLALVCDERFVPEALGRALDGHLRWFAAIELLFVERIPRNIMGKVERRALREAAAARLRPAAGGGPDRAGPHRGATRA